MAACNVTNKHLMQRERERELRREGGKSLLAYVKGVDPPYLIYIDRPRTHLMHITLKKPIGGISCRAHDDDLYDK